GMTTVAPFGAWRSPLSAERVAAASLGLGCLAVDGDAIWWIEGRPAEQGRAVLVSWRPGTEPRDAIPPPWNARTRVHEYGGGARVLLPPAGPAGVPARGRGGAPRAHAAGAVALRGRRHRPAPRPAPGGRRGASLERRAPQLSRAHRARGTRNARRAGGWMRLLRRAPAQPRRRDARLDRVAPTGHAVGPQRALDRTDRP